MSKSLVAYFSASGTTKRLAEKAGKKKSKRIYLRFRQRHLTPLRTLTGGTVTAEVPSK